MLTSYFETNRFDIRGRVGKNLRRVANVQRRCEHTRKSCILCTRVNVMPSYELLIGANNLLNLGTFLPYKFCFSRNFDTSDAMLFLKVQIEKPFLKSLTRKICAYQKKLQIVLYLKKK